VVKDNKQTHAGVLAHNHAQHLPTQHVRTAISLRSLTLHMWGGWEEVRESGMRVQACRQVKT